MPPKIKITREDILETAVEIVKSEGAQSINARSVASRLNCSTQPIFSNFKTMDELRLAVVEKAYNLCYQYIQDEIQKGTFPSYKASGMAYIRFAKEEKELFKLLFMRDRTGEPLPATTKLDVEINALVQKNTGLDEMDAKLFHLEMWVCVHGIATMVATNYTDLEWDLISRILSDFYMGIRKQYGLE